ncbi:hypothetical protein BLNAU_22496 [Blattamonas nauphoetae]|uniref:Transposase n=1 Tax=Blattamonas nauphoetae TaxID=2049346 RepID=A0ABQ9WTY4_9EUKA|nr:hypothetical protein BLNAU_22496 [Blattamonas nauphoetae]
MCSVPPRMAIALVQQNQKLGKKEWLCSDQNKKTRRPGAHLIGVVHLVNACCNENARDESGEQFSADRKDEVMH